MSEIFNKSNITIIIRKYKNLIIQYIQTPEIINMKNNNFNEFKKHMYDNFVEFRYNYPIVFDILISGQNIEMLDVMLNNLDDLNNSADFDNDLKKIRFSLGEKLHDIYVKDKIIE